MKQYFVIAEVDAEDLDLSLLLSPSDLSKLESRLYGKIKNSEFVLGEKFNIKFSDPPDIEKMDYRVITENQEGKPSGVNLRAVARACNDDIAAVKNAAFDEGKKALEKSNSSSSSDEQSKKIKLLLWVTQENEEEKLGKINARIVTVSNKDGKDGFVQFSPSPPRFTKIFEFNESDFNKKFPLLTKNESDFNKKFPLLTKRAIVTGIGVLGIMGGLCLGLAIVAFAPPVALAVFGGLAALKAFALAGVTVSVANLITFGIGATGLSIAGLAYRSVIKSTAAAEQEFSKAVLSPIQQPSPSIDYDSLPLPPSSSSSNSTSTPSSTDVPTSSSSSSSSSSSPLLTTSFNK